MGKIVGDSACPECRKNGHDSGGDHLLHFEDGGKYCSKSEHHDSGKPYHEGGTGEEHLSEVDEKPVKRRLRKNDMKLDEVGKYPIKKLTERGIDRDICKHYGIRTESDTKNGEDKSYYYPVYNQKGKLIAYKQRSLPKKFFWVGSVAKKKPMLFGQDVTPKGGLKLLICEGQDDMLAASQMLWRRYPTYTPSVVSLIHGDKASSVADNLEFVNSFKEVLICTDDDTAGRKVGKEIAELIGDKARMVTFSEKDANAMLDEGKEKEFLNAFFQAAPYAPDGFVTVDDVWDQATKMPEWGKPWPWPSLTKMTYGRRLGEGMYLGAGAKIGKSDFVNQFIDFLIKEEEKVVIFKFEESADYTVRKIAGKMKHKQFHVPDAGFTQDELIEGVQAVKDADILMYGKYGTATWEGVESAIRWAVSQGYTNVIIDPLTRLVSADPAEANKQLIEISDTLSKMAKDLGFFYLVCTHLNAPKTGKPHEEGGAVQSYQFTGSRAMMRTCYYMVGLERNKKAEDEDERNTTRFVMLDDRAFGKSGSFDIKYDQDTGDYLEPTRRIGGSY